MLLLFLYAVLCVGLAALNYDRISEGKKIYHAFNGLIHLTSFLLTWKFFGLKEGLSLLLVARVSFDVSLNLMRDLPIDYVSKSPKSIIDKLEKKVFGMNGYLPKILYLFTVVVLIFI